MLLCGTQSGSATLPRHTTTIKLYRDFNRRAGLIGNPPSARSINGKSRNSRIMATNTKPQQKGPSVFGDRQEATSLPFTSRRSAVIGVRGMVACSQPIAAEVLKSRAHGFGVSRMRMRTCPCRNAAAMNERCETSACRPRDMQTCFSASLWMVKMHCLFASEHDHAGVCTRECAPGGVHQECYVAHISCREISVDGLLAPQFANTYGDSRRRTSELG